MKLPEEFGKSTINTANDLRIAEAIVRDCAKVCRDMFENGNKGGLACEKTILTRYGLEPQEKQT